MKLLWSSIIIWFLAGVLGHENVDDENITESKQELKTSIINGKKAVQPEKDFRFAGISRIHASDSLTVRKDNEENFDHIKDLQNRDREVSESFGPVARERTVDSSTKQAETSGRAEESQKHVTESIKDEELRGGDVIENITDQPTTFVALTLRPNEENQQTHFPDTNPSKDTAEKKDMITVDGTIGTIQQREETSTTDEEPPEIVETTDETIIGPARIHHELYNDRKTVLNANRQPQAPTFHQQPSMPGIIPPQDFDNEETTLGSTRLEESTTATKNQEDIREPKVSEKRPDGNPDTDLTSDLDSDADETESKLEGPLPPEVTAVDPFAKPTISEGISTVESVLAITVPSSISSHETSSSESIHEEPQSTTETIESSSTFTAIPQAGQDSTDHKQDEGTQETSERDETVTSSVNDAKSHEISPTNLPTVTLPTLPQTERVTFEAETTSKSTNSKAGPLIETVTFAMEPSEAIDDQKESSKTDEKLNINNTSGENPTQLEVDHGTKDEEDINEEILFVGDPSIFSQSATFSELPRITASESSTLSPSFHNNDETSNVDVSKSVVSDKQHNKDMNPGGDPDEKGEGEKSSEAVSDANQEAKPEPEPNNEPRTTIKLESAKEGENESIHREDHSKQQETELENEREPSTGNDFENADSENDKLKEEFNSETTPVPEPESTPEPRTSEPEPTSEPKAEPEPAPDHNHNHEVTDVRPQFFRTPFSFKITSIDFSNEFENPISGKFKKLRDQLLPDLEEIFGAIFTEGYRSVKISGFTKGSIVVDGFVETVEKPEDSEQLATEFEERITAKNTQLGGNDIDVRSVTFDGFVSKNYMERQQDGYTSEGSPTYLIGGGIALGILAILLTALAIIAVNNRRMNRTLKLKEESIAMAESGRSPWSATTTLNISRR